VLGKNTDELFTEIANLAEGNKGEFQQAPIVLEIENKHFQVNEVAVLIEILTQNNMVAIGIRSPVQELIDFAYSLSGTGFSCSLGLASSGSFGGTTTLSNTAKPANLAKSINSCTGERIPIATI
jgi:hypothetical protein